MNESELRRQELLRQTRKLYNDHNELPAVHPRYGRICSSLYGDGTRARRRLHRSAVPRSRNRSDRIWTRMP